MTGFNTKFTYRKSESVDDAKIIIESIKTQENNKTRFSIFADGQFIIGVSDSALVHFSLRKGSELNAQMLRDIELFEDRWKARE